MKIDNPLSFNMANIQDVLRMLSSQESCDGTPYNEMILAAKYIDQLENSNFEMEDVLNQINKMIRLSYVNLGDDLNYQIFAMFGRDKTK